jgi:hypothetical protein
MRWLFFLVVNKLLRGGLGGMIEHPLCEMINISKHGLLLCGLFLIGLDPDLTVVQSVEEHIKHRG